MRSFSINRDIRNLIRKMTMTGLGLFVGIMVVEITLWVILLTPLWHVLPVVRPILVQPNMTSGTELLADGVFIWPEENRTKVRINSYGLRDRELIARTVAGGVRVVLTGDSIVEALQVNQSDTMDSRAERRLSELGYDVEIVNLGAAGHGPLRQLVRLEHIGLQLKPDVIVSIAAAGDFISGELLTDLDHPGYVRDPDDGLVRGDTFKRSFSRHYSDRWQGKSVLTLLRYSNVFRVIYAMRSREVPDLLGLPSVIEAAPIDACSTEELTRLHRLWIDRFSKDNWDATEMFFDEYAESIRRSEAVPVYALRQIPVPPDSCTYELALRAEMISAVESHLDELDIKFIDWDFELLRSHAFTSTDASVISVLHGFGTAIGSGHFNLQGHKASGEVLTNIVLSEIATHP